MEVVGEEIVGLQVEIEGVKEVGAEDFRMVIEEEVEALIEEKIGVDKVGIVRMEVVLVVLFVGVGMCVEKVIGGVEVVGTEDVRMIFEEEARLQEEEKIGVDKVGIIGMEVMEIVAEEVVGIVVEEVMGVEEEEKIGVEVVEIVAEEGVWIVVGIVVRVELGMVEEETFVTVVMDEMGLIAGVELVIVLMVDVIMWEEEDTLLVIAKLDFLLPILDLSIFNIELDILLTNLSNL